MENTIKWKRKVLCVVIPLIVLAAIVLVVLMRCSDTESFAQRYHLNSYDEIISAVPVQNGTIAQCTEVRGNDIVTDKSDWKALYEVLENVKVSDAEKKERYQITGFVLANPVIECKVKDGREFVIAWEYPTSLLKIGVEVYTISQSDAEKLYRIIQNHNDWRGEPWM